MAMRYDRLKRALDVTVSGVGLLVTAPLQVAVAIAVRRFHGRPILFKQARPGTHGEVFQLVKFRTMIEPDDAHRSDAERLTPFGRWLRSTSLDELPSLWNVLRGDMSLVGPRPLLVEYLPLYNQRQMRRHEVRPGITGWAQINGRNTTTWQRRLELDVEYVDNRSLTMDAKILLRTVLTVVRRSGISSEGEATMAKFQGSQS